MNKLYYGTFQTQIGKPLTYEMIDKMYKKFGEITYFNGDKMEFGDYLFYALVKNIDENNSFTLIKLCDRHFHLFEVDNLKKSTTLPTIKLKDEN